MESKDENHESSSKDEDSGITMVDVLQEEEELENDAEAVLGAGDDSTCTYNQGYMKRQPLYACVTCCPASGNVLAGVCLGCSYHCHEGHDLVELYTKRYFRCDCGNTKFPGNSCKLSKEKVPVNSENEYNQNFQGKYCTCSRPYPDPEDSTEDSMIQCIICEDWYHGRHLKVETLPLDEDFAEMICQLCVANLPFLRYYSRFSVTTSSETTTDVDVTTTENCPKRNCNDSDSNHIQDNEKNVIKQNNEQGTCKLKGVCEKYDENDRHNPLYAMFMLENWRKELCSCIVCKETYKKLKVSFLTDLEDTVTFYESEGRTKRQASRGIQRELDALSSLDRITRTEVVHEYNNLSVSLREYLKKFAENGKVVRDEDIREFFSQLSANKKQRNEGVQYFCK